MPTFSLVSEPTRATVSSHFPKALAGPSVLPAAVAPAEGVERIQRRAAIELYASSESDIEGDKGSLV
jgi:hypothetical protein